MPRRAIVEVGALDRAQVAPCVRLSRGHVAAALVLGCRVSAAWLHARGGRTLFTRPRNARDAAVIALCGTIARLRAEPGSPLAASDDFKMIDRCGDQRACRAQAQALVDEYWSLVEAVALELIEHGELQLCAAVAQRIGLTLTG
jgi:hypothetical protein